LDRRGRLRGGFRGTAKQDEIGDLSRALERLTNRLDSHQEFSESFASDVSHEFKNPLASIRNATEMLSEVDDPDERARFLDVVEREVARMERLLTSLRDVALIDARLSEEEKLPLDLGELLRRIVEGFELREGERVELRTRLPEREVFVHASSERLVQVFENLLDNSVSFSPLGGTIGIELRREKDEAVVLISDRGPGLPDTDRQRVFDRFFTYRPQEGRNSVHTGLGLAIVRAIVEGYGGSVSLRNRPEGGVVAEVRLPAQ
ncbi:MAG: ATP-binding protein, partial [Thermoanaerobaculia bacterium]|nr:ATP-binding protein [Thermoanaerobaculia bacterium]